MTSVNNILKCDEGMIRMKKSIRNAIQLIIFVSIAALPFISMTNILGIETFLDSFENPESYLCLDDTSQISGILTAQDDFLIMQTSDHPDFIVQEHDTILYFEIDGDIACSKISQINGVGVYKKYYTEFKGGTCNKDVIFESQVIGKVVKVIENNIWNEMSIRLWEFSIEKLSF